MNTLQTIKNLHEKFPQMGVQLILDILDCIIEYEVPECTMELSSVEPKYTSISSIDTIADSSAFINKL